MAGLAARAGTEVANTSATITNATDNRKTMRYLLLLTRFQNKVLSSRTKFLAPTSNEVTINT